MTTTYYVRRQGEDWHLELEDRRLEVAGTRASVLRAARTLALLNAGRVVVEQDDGSWEDHEVSPFQ
ncbi:MAG: hypothetical protein WD206_05075 [Actinomycetota bacterium]